VQNTTALLERIVVYKSAHQHRRTLYHRRLVRLLSALKQSDQRINTLRRCLAKASMPIAASAAADDIADNDHGDKDVNNTISCSDDVVFAAAFSAVVAAAVAWRKCLVANAAAAVVVVDLLRTHYFAPFAVAVAAMLASLRDAHARSLVSSPSMLSLSRDATHDVSTFATVGMILLTHSYNFASVHCPNLIFSNHHSHCWRVLRVQ
jgi:hypothetical protein